jgi:ribosome-associated protein
MMNTQQLLQVVLTTLDDGKGRDVKVIDIREKTSIADFMVIASGTSERHVRSLAEHVVEESRKVAMIPVGVEGEQPGEWVLVDLGDVIVHVMKPQTREFYQLEKLWQGDYSRLYPALDAIH